MHRVRTKSAPATEARVVRAMKAKKAEDDLLELERAAMLNDSDIRQVRAAENRGRLLRNSRRIKELDAKRFDHDAREAEDFELGLFSRHIESDEEKRFDSDEAIRMLAALERVERNADRAKRAMAIQEEIAREREEEALADAELDAQRIDLASRRRVQALLSRTDVARRSGAERQVESIGRVEALARARETDAALRRVELDLQSRIAEAKLRQKELSLSRQIREQREDEILRARRRADRRALGEAEYADYCDELKAFWRVEEKRSNRLVERALTAKVSKAREHHERIQRARVNHQRLKEQESAWKDLVETELSHRLNRVARLQNEKLRAFSDVRALGETAQRELMRSRHADRESVTFDKVDRDCRVFNHVVMRHELKEPSW